MQLEADRIMGAEAERDRRIRARGARRWVAGIVEEGRAAAHRPPGSPRVWNRGGRTRGGSRRPAPGVPAGQMLDTVADAPIENVTDRRPAHDGQRRSLAATSKIAAAGDRPGPGVDLPRVLQDGVELPRRLRAGGDVR
ncbi:MAG: hypothetical protein KF850_34090 [Labilithrix sp.]|nr:hypothetical protein [Labilithrix sp.]